MKKSMNNKVHNTLQFTDTTDTEKLKQISNEKKKLSENIN